MSRKMTGSTELVSSDAPRHGESRGPMRDDRDATVFGPREEERSLRPGQPAKGGGYGEPLLSGEFVCELR